MAGRIVRFFVIPLVLALFFGYIAATFFPNHARDYLPPELARPEYAKVDQNKPIEGQTRTVEIGGRVFKFPLKYIEVLDDKGTHQKGVLLKVIWPDMKSLFDLKDRREYDQMWKGRRFGNIELSAASESPSLGQMIENGKRFVPPWKFVGKSGALEEYTEYRKSRSSDDQPTLIKPWLETFLERDANGSITAIINCHDYSLVGPPPPTPVCVEQFVDKGILYVIHYSEAHFFAEWQEQRRRAISFINSFDVTPNIKKQSSGG